MGGRFASVYPLYDGTNRMLVSWSPCLVLDTTVTPNGHRSLHRVEYRRHQRARWRRRSTRCGSTIWTQGTLGPLLSADVGHMVLEPMILQRTHPCADLYSGCRLHRRRPRPTMVNAGVGLLDISSVYDVDGVDTATPSIAGRVRPEPGAVSPRVPTGSSESRKPWKFPARRCARSTIPRSVLPAWACAKS